MLLGVVRRERTGAAAEFVPVTDAMLQNPDPADWLMWRRTLDLWGYSPLTQIDRGNVAQLRMVWTRALGPGIQEGTPLVHDGVMYFPNPSDITQAFDAATRRPALGVPARAAERPRRVLPGAVDQPQPRDLRQP